MDHYPLMIQCKTNGYVPPKERIELQEAVRKYQGFVLIAYREGRKLKFRNVDGVNITNI